MLIVFVGESGSGKTTACDYLEEKYGIKQIRTYTTRQPREKDNSHVWSDIEYYRTLDKDEIICETVYGDDVYWTERYQVEPKESCVIQSIVVDMNGLRALRETDIPLYVIHIKVDAEKRAFLLKDHYNEGFIYPTKTIERLNRDPDIPFIPNCTVIDGNCGLKELYQRLDEVIEGYVL